MPKPPPRQFSVRLRPHHYEALRDRAHQLRTPLAVLAARYVIEGLECELSEDDLAAIEAATRAEQPKPKEYRDPREVVYGPGHDFSSLLTPAQRKQIDAENAARRKGMNSI